MSDDLPPKSAGVRPLTANERGVLDALLGHEFPGVNELRVQARQASASPGCTCGCGTIALHVRDDSPRSSASHLVPVEGKVVGADGEQIGGVILFVTDGRLSSLEVYDFVDERLPMPSLDRVRW